MELIIGEVAGKKIYIEKEYSGKMYYF